MKVWGQVELTPFYPSDRLHDLIVRRNDIGHGAIIEPPPNADFDELCRFTENLIAGYCDAFIAWMKATFKEESA